MGTMILIVCLVVFAILAGWWLNRERNNQKKELIRQGKIAAGKFDEIDVPVKKPKKRKRQKRAGNWLDPKYVPAELPTKIMLDEWLDAAAKLVDELMPHVHAHRTAAEEAKPLQASLQAASEMLYTYFPGSKMNALEAQNWFLGLEGALKTHEEARLANELVQRQVQKCYDSVRYAWFDLQRLVKKAEDWETYKAPESFHEKLELAGLLCSAIKSEFDLENMTVADLPTGRKERRRVNALERTTEDWGASMWKPPVQDKEIVERARQAMLTALTHVAVLGQAAASTQDAQTAYNEASKQPTVTRPTRPSDDEVDALLAAVHLWARFWQEARVQMFQCAEKVKPLQKGIDAQLEPLVQVLAELDKAEIPDGDKLSKDAVIRAHGLVVKYLKYLPDQLKTAFSYGAPCALDGRDPQSQQDIANNLRNLMRKAAFAMAQSEVAKAAHEAAKAEKVQLAETVAPVLTQSSAAAFINVHARMTEIGGRNNKKTEAQKAKVQQLATQAQEREKQVAQAMAALLAAVTKVSGNRAEWSANLEAAHAAATFFCNAFRK